MLSKQATKDAKKLTGANLAKKAKELLDILETDPYEPPYEKLRGDLKDYYSRRINVQHRLVYQIFDENRTVRVLRMWSHYE
ncbi:Txe/YoeB family addiction module toxin [cf. Phormidesmis sp. LEGE 11477]|uniref:Txe/YoeB family addiction module toxin n=1 Tax=cf. Phormidesmis sp. LEGE 11477 TaxID=1828680 RepID=UPI00187E041A|nr:Txe/YoeB family addiction module toxin [cf. Phormidesmis sp. LEGE 11477]